MRRRSQAPSNAYSPAFVSLVSSSSGVASFASTIRSTVPNSPRTTRPSCGRVGGEDARERDRGVVLAARLEHGVEVGAGHERHVAVDDDDLGRDLGDRVEGGPDRVAGPARLLLEGEVGPVGEGRR